LAYAFGLCLGRKPSAREQEVLTHLLRREREVFARDPQEALQAAPDAPARADAVERAAWTSVARALLNLDELITREEPRMPPPKDHLLLQTRRHFFQECALGIGSVALASLLNEGRASAPASDPLAPRPGHYTARARSVIFLFMAGGPSQLELFDYKPRLVE